MVFLFFALFFSCMDDVAIYKPVETGDKDKDAFLLVNYYRAELGLSPITLDPLLSRGCYAHGMYIKHTGDFSHIQKKSSWSGDFGAQAGHNSLLAKGVSGTYHAIETWMQSLYHRIPLLDPGLVSIGIASIHDIGENYYVIMDVLSRRDPQIVLESPLLYPAPGQRAIPVVFSGIEDPDPIPEAYSRPTGPLLTVSFPEDDTISLLSDKPRLRDRRYGVDWEVYAKFDDRMHNVFALIPREVLLPGTTYDVDFSVLRSGKLYNPSWSFTTMREGFGVNSAIDHLF